MRRSIKWRRVAWLALVWTFVVNEGTFTGACKRACNPRVVASCEP
jgi:hypothetical protein